MRSERRALDAVEDTRLIERVAGAVARVKGLGTNDANAFVVMVRSRMAAPAPYPAAFETALQRQAYLTVVVARLLKDWQPPATDRSGVVRPTPP